MTHKEDIELANIVSSNSESSEDESEKGEAGAKSDEAKVCIYNLFKN